MGRQRFLVSSAERMPTALANSSRRINDEQDGGGLKTEGPMGVTEIEEKRIDQLLLIP